jgi:hypothetical protein
MLHASPFGLIRMQMQALFSEAAFATVTGNTSTLPDGMMGMHAFAHCRKFSW